MASDTSKYTKIISIELDSNDLIKNLSDVRIEQDKIRQSQQELNKGYKDGKITQEQYANATVKNQEAMKALYGQSRQYSTELQNNIKIAKSAEDAYNKLAAQYSNNVAKMDAMSKSQLEQSEEGKNLVKQTRELREEMIKLKEQQGNHTLSVGDYSKATRGLSFAISQIARETPNAAQSAQIFFMSISNNIAGVADAIQLVKLENASLAAQGQATTPVWKQVVSAVFSWQTALMLGVTAMTIFGPKLVKLIGDMFDVSRAIDIAKESQEAFNRALEESAKSAAKELSHLDLLYKGTQNHSKSIAERTSAVEQLKQEYPAYFGQMTTEQILAGEASAKYNALRDSILEVSKARAAEKVISEYQEKILLNDISIQEKRIKLKEEELRVSKLQAQQLREAADIASIATTPLAPSNEMSLTFIVTSAKKGVKELKDEIIELGKTNKDLNLVIENISNGVNLTSLNKQDKGIGSTKADYGNDANEIKDISSRMDDLAQKYFDLSKIPEPKNLKVDLNELFPEDTEWAEKKAQISDYLKAQEESYKIQILMAGDAEIKKNEAIIQASEARIAYLSSLDEVQLAQQFGSVDAGKIAILEAEKAKQEAINRTAEATQQATEEQLSALADMFGAMSTLLSEFSEQNEAMALLSKGLALVEITLNTGKAISGAIAAAQSVPFPGNLIAIATGITAVLTGITQAKQALSASKMPKNDVKKVKKPKFHTGGEVDGSGEVDATLLGGERVMTIAANTQFSAALASLESAASGSVLSLSNYQGGQGMEFFKEAFAAALREQKQPVVSVMDIIVAQERINIADTIVKN